MDADVSMVMKRTTTNATTLLALLYFIKWYSMILIDISSLKCIILVFVIFTSFKHLKMLYLINKQ